MDEDDEIDEDEPEEEDNDDEYGDDFTDNFVDYQQKSKRNNKSSFSSQVQVKDLAIDLLKRFLTQIKVQKFRLK